MHPHCKRYVARIRPVLLLVAWSLCVWLFAVGAANAQQDGPFRSIFDGKTLDGWEGDPRFWRVEDGYITGETTADDPTEANTFLIWRDGDVDDFELRLEYRLFGHNSGIQIRSEEDQKWRVRGYQADMDAANKYTGTLYEERGRGILAMRGQQLTVDGDGQKKVIELGDREQLATHIESDDWNEYHVVARGNKITLTINGVIMSRLIDLQTSHAKRSGVLALQLHRGPPMKVQFRNVRLRRLRMPDVKKVVFLAGTRSHGYGSHEHNAGCLLLAKALNDSGIDVHAVVYRNGWPRDATALDNADSIVVYCDGGDKHMVNDHLSEVGELMKQGVGLVCLHYGVEVPKGRSGDALLDWIGGYFETYYSVNPHWVAEFKELPSHPITRGVNPFSINDEWYYHMRFREGMQGVTPILSAVPPEETRTNRWGHHHGGNQYVAARKGMAEHVAWARQREDGGRGFGFSGGHFHWNWGHDDFRKLVLNAIVWTAGGDVPDGGVASVTPTRADLEANQDYPKPADGDLPRRRARQKAARAKTAGSR